MKTALFFFALLLLTTSFGQYNYPEHFESHKAGKYKPQPYEKNPLLDNYDLCFVHLDLEVSNSTTFLKGNVLLKTKVVNNPMSTFAAEFIDGMTVDSIFIDNVLHSFSHSGDILSVELSPEIPVGDTIDVKVYYQGVPSAGGGFFTGVSNDSDGWTGSVVTWTLSESFHAREWWPTKQDLTDKADSSWFYITCTDNLKAGSNGLLTNTVSLPDSKVRYEWKSSYPIVYYLISFAVAQYQDYSIYANPAGSDPILIQNYVYENPAFLSYYQAELDRTAELIELFSEKFGLYPFNLEKYGHCTAPLGGGMEHQTMTTMGYYQFWIIAHELGHMWFGDDVTCATWQDIWINEGFASYTEYIAMQFLNSQIDADEWMETAHSYALDEPSGSVFIPLVDAENESRIFSYALSYKKGASLVHMIRFAINNDSLFFATIRDYLEIYGDSVATGDDFKEVLENNTSIDFTQFFNQWYYGKGFPTFDVLWYQYGSNLHFTSLQSTSSTSTPLFITDMEYLITFTDAPDTLIRVLHDATSVDYIIPVSGTVSNIIVDPSNWILNGDGDVIAGLPFVKDYSAFFSAYPNPASEKINFVFSQETAKTLEISDVSGRILIRNENVGKELIVNTSKLKSGLYFAKVMIANQQFVEKIIIQ